MGMPLPSLIQTAMADRRGVFAVMGALLLPVVLILLLLVVDYGRTLAARLRWQGIAEAVALAAAAELDRRPDALERGARAMRTVLQLEQETARDSADYTLDRLEWLTPEGRITRDAVDAASVAVTLNGVELASFSSRAVGMLQTDRKSPSGGFQLTPHARATNQTLVCNAVPLALCSPELAGEGFASSSMIGRQILMQEGVGGLVPLCLPGGNCQAEAIGRVLADSRSGYCGSPDVQAAPMPFRAIHSALALRLGNASLWGADRNHPGFTRYPRDLGVRQTGPLPLGDGYWDRSYYWRAARGIDAPPDLLRATRYQTYLYEMALPFGVRGRETFFPLHEDLPSDVIVLRPFPTNRPTKPLSPEALPYRGAETDPNRRVLTLGHADCRAGQIGTIRNWLRLFVTEAPTADGLRAEIIGVAAPQEPGVFAQGRVLP